jgi:hypothetical protein
LFEKTPAPDAAEDPGVAVTTAVAGTVVVGGGGGPSEDVAVVAAPVVVAALVWTASEPAGVTVETTIGVSAGVKPG